jgi:Flp pilus assembly protein TadG
VSDRAPRGDPGSVAVETVILVPVLIALVATGVVAGRMSNSRGDVAAAAQHAAREISIARTPTAAVATAESNARATLQVGDPTCRSMQFTPTITASEVTVEVSCVVDLSAATTLPVPGSVIAAAQSTQAIDRYREVTP